MREKEKAINWTEMMKGLQENHNIWTQGRFKTKKHKIPHGRDGRKKKEGRLRRSKIMEGRSYLT